MTHDPTTRPLAHRPTSRRTLIVALAALLALGGVVAAPGPATADLATADLAMAETTTGSATATASATGSATATATAIDSTAIDAITSVTITEPTDQVRLWDRLRVEATWSVPDGSRAGDTFTLTFPRSPRVRGFEQTFDLESPTGAVVGTCVVGRNALTCTLGSYVEAVTDVRGTLRFWGQATTVGAGPFGFTAGAVPFPAPVPGGSVLPRADWDAPQRPVKGGWFDPEGETAVWEVFVPGAFLAEASGPVVVTDVYDPRLVMRDSSLVVAHVAVADWNGGDYADKLVLLSPGSGYSYAPDPARSTFDVTIVDPVTDGSRLYVIRYATTLPVQLLDGDVLVNRVAGSNGWSDDKVLRFAGAGGEGQGNRRGALRVTKSVTGAGAERVQGVEFTVGYTAERNGSSISGRLTITDGDAATLPGLAAGTVVTLREVTPPAVDGVRWGTPVFAGVGVLQVTGGAQVVVGAGAMVEVLLENPTTWSIPALPVGPAHPAEPVVPPAVAPPTTPMTPLEPGVPSAVGPTDAAVATSAAARPREALVMTGAAAAAAVGVAALVLCVGVALLVLRRRAAGS
ncbi:DUF5979 domain-containing protein [Oerskovia turbata]